MHLNLMTYYQFFSLHMYVPHICSVFHWFHSQEIISKHVRTYRLLYVIISNSRDLDINLSYRESNIFFVEHVKITQRYFSRKNCLSY